MKNVYTRIKTFCTVLFDSKVVNELDKGMVTKFNDYNTTDPDLTKAIDKLQQEVCILIISKNDEKHIMHSFVI